MWDVVPNLSDLSAFFVCIKSLTVNFNYSTDRTAAEK